MNNNNHGKCKTTKRNGEPCKNFPMAECDFCYVHSLGKTKGVVWWKNPNGHILAVIGILATVWFGIFGPTRANQEAIQNNQVEAVADRQSKHDEIAKLLADISKCAGISGTDISLEDALAYKAIVAQIYGNLNPKAVIRLSDAISSQTNDITHTVDISIRSVQANQEILTVINIYPTSFPIDEKKVQSFAEVLSDLGASKGIMVCNAGFTRPAKTLAPGLGIELCSIQDSRYRKWSEDIKIPVLLTKQKPFVSFRSTMRIEAGEVLPIELAKWRFSRDKGGTSFSVVDIFMDLWNRKLIPQSQEGLQKINLNANDWFRWSVTKSTWIPVSQPVLIYDIREQGTWLKYFTPKEYMAVQDEQSQNITVTKLDVRLGPFEIDNTWIPVSDKSLLISRNRGVLLSLEQVHTHLDTF